MRSGETCDVIVLGAGAAGLMCAIEAGKRGRSVVVLERNRTIGEKIRISGGGRCNFTNRATDRRNYLSANPHFCTSALARFPPERFIALVEKHGIRYHEKKLGQMFCDGSALAILAMLEAECAGAHARIEVGCSVTDVSKDGRFVAGTPAGTMTSESLVVATGGLSIPKLGATDFGYRVAQKFNVPVTPTRPGLVPLTFGPDDVGFFSSLSGVSLEGVVTCGEASFRENILFTHRGLSGPAILQVSSYWTPGTAIALDLAPGIDVQDLLEQRRGTREELSSVLSGIVPRRFAAQWCERYAPSRPMHQYGRRDLSAIAALLHEWRIIPAGTGGFAKAEVTRGGVDTRELSSKTMEAKHVPGLFFIGEVVDVTGQLGGHNFQWAWASGFAAGQYA